MENNKETAYKGFVLNGFVALLLVIVLFAAIFYCFYRANSTPSFGILGALLFVLTVICINGFVKLEPNEAVALVFFGKYRGTFSKDGFYWVNPLMSKKKVSLRARNLNPEPIKVNDKVGNPVLIGMVLASIFCTTSSVECFFTSSPETGEKVWPIRAKSRRMYS